MDLQKIRKEFPILRQKVNGFPLVYLDSAATSQKPRVVIDEIKRYYEEYNSNTHRSVHTLADRATEAYEKARSAVAEFIHADLSEIIFVRNSNEGINLVAGGICELMENLSYQSSVVSFQKKVSQLSVNRFLKTEKQKTDELGSENRKQKTDNRITILTTIAEHHANFVPWLRLQKEGKAKMEFMPIDKNGEWDLEWLKKFVKNYFEKGGHRGPPLLIAVNHVSNVLGVVNPIGEIREIVGSRGLILIDAAQSVAHMPIDVKKIDCDFLVFSGHKVFGPTGTSVLWGKKELLDMLPPFLVGSSMISEVTTKDYQTAEIPTKFEAGTPDICGAIGLGVAVEWLSKIRRQEDTNTRRQGIENGELGIENHEKKLLKITIEGLEKIKGVHVIGSHDVKKKSGLVAFYVDGVHPHDVAAVLDSKGIAIRTGHHCAMPLHTYLGINASIRMSLSIFNTEEEVLFFIDTLNEAVTYLQR